MSNQIINELHGELQNSRVSVADGGDVCDAAAMERVMSQNPHVDEHRVLEGECLIYVGPEPWDGLWRNRHQLMSRFAKKNTVIYIEPRLSIRKLLRGIADGTIRFRDLFSRTFSVTKDGVHVYHPPKWLPVNEKPLLKQLTDFGWRWMLRRKAKALGAKRPIVWLSRPDMVKLIGDFNEKLLVYHVVDEYLGYYGQTEARKKEIADRERLMLQRADVVIVVSANLMRAKSLYNKNTFLVPNAVDFDAYAKAEGNAFPEIKRPIIGYSGLISNRLDIGLLISLSDRHPGWSFVFIGDVVRDHCEEQMADLERQKNTYFLGRKDIEELPAFVRFFDVGIIPYKSDLQADNVSPLKIYEYMAAGLPIVTSDFSVARELSHMVYVCDSVDDFESALMTCIDKAEESQERVQKGTMLAKQNTWDRRVQQISHILKSADKVKRGECVV